MTYNNLASVLEIISLKYQSYQTRIAANVQHHIMYPCVYFFTDQSSLMSDDRADTLFILQGLPTT